MAILFHIQFIDILANHDLPVVVCRLKSCGEIDLQFTCSPAECA